MQTRLGVATALFAIAAAGCGSDGPTPTDAGSDVQYVGDVPIPQDTGGVSRAGQPCADSIECGTLICNLSVPGGICDAVCAESASDLGEQQECGGSGSTCLTARLPGQGDSSHCVHSCMVQRSPAGAVLASGCRPNQVCTNYSELNSISMFTDSPGCEFFCTMDNQCGAGTTCTRRGVCQPPGRPVDTLAPDGYPCDPTQEPDPAQMPSAFCRGICFAVVGAMANQGVCGSRINLEISQDCPDHDPAVTPLGSPTDNLAHCVYRSCSCDGDCAAPLRCVQASTGTARVCTYLTTGLSGTACAGSH
jgi:hypothetical protein